MTGDWVDVPIAAPPYEVQRNLETGAVRHRRMRARVYWNRLDEAAAKLLHRIREPWRDGTPPKAG